MEDNTRGFYAQERTKATFIHRAFLGGGGRKGRKNAGLARLCTARRWIRYEYFRYASSTERYHFSMSIEQAGVPTLESEILRSLREGGISRFRSGSRTYEKYASHILKNRPKKKEFLVNPVYSERGFKEDVKKACSLLVSKNRLKFRRSGLVFFWFSRSRLFFLQFFLSFFKWDGVWEDLSHLETIWRQGTQLVSSVAKAQIRGPCRNNCHPPSNFGHRAVVDFLLMVNQREKIQVGESWKM